MITSVSPIPRAISGALQIYLAQDGNLYAVNTSDGRAYLVTSGAAAAGPSGVPEAPTDSQLYGRKNAAWSVVPAGGGGAFDATSVRFFDDFEADLQSAATLGPWKIISPSGVGVSILPGSVHENGVWQLTGGLGFCPLATRTPIILGTNTVSARWRVMIPTLPTGAEHIQYVFGLLNGVPGSDNLNVAFVYENTTSANWRTRFNSIDTGVAVVAGRWYDLIIVTDPVNSTYFIGSNNAVPVQVAQILTSNYFGTYPGNASIVAPYAGGYIYSGTFLYNADCYEQKIVWPANRLLL